MSSGLQGFRVPGPRRRSAWWWASVVLGVLGTVLVGVALHGLLSWGAGDDRAVAGRSQLSEATGPASSPSGPVRSPGHLPGSGKAAAPRVPPVHLRIPTIGLSQDLLRLGLNGDGTVQVPTSAQADQPGWYKLGPSPGQTGSAVVLGHVDSVRGPAVFYRLRSLGRGDRVDVRLRSGKVAHFEVQRVATYPNEKFPARKVYASHGYPALQLVTCGGAYDKQTGYTANVVVFTRLVGSST